VWGVGRREQGLGTGALGPVNELAQVCTRCAFGLRFRSSGHVHMLLTIRYVNMSEIGGDCKKTSALGPVNELAQRVADLGLMFRVHEFRV
jgi:hypothetical protein